MASESGLEAQRSGHLPLLLVLAELEEVNLGGRDDPGVYIVQVAEAARHRQPRAAPLVVLVLVQPSGFEGLGLAGLDVSA